MCVKPMRSRHLHRLLAQIRVRVSAWLERGWLWQRCSQTTQHHKRFFWLAWRLLVVRNWLKYYIHFTLADIDECTGNDGICQHGGSCRNHDGFYRCDCSTGYTGTNCETGALIKTHMNKCAGSMLLRWQHMHWTRRETALHSCTFMQCLDACSHNLTEVE